MYIENCMGKSPIMKKMCKLTISFEMKFSYFKCVAYLYLVPILKSSRRRLVKLFETATLLEGRVAVSNNFTKRRRDDFKIGTRDK